MGTILHKLYGTPSSYRGGQVSKCFGQEEELKNSAPEK